MSERRERSRPLTTGVLAGLGAGALWGLVFVAPHMAPGLSSLDLAAGRFVSYGMVAVLLLALVPGSKAWPSASQALWALGLSVLGFTGYYWLLVLAIRDAGTEVPLARVVLTCLALTWLNPHVYLDTLALLGALSAQYAPQEWTFGLGAVLSSLTFFAALGYGARFLAPLLARPGAWVVVEALIGAVMWAIAASLVMQALGGT